MSNDIYPLTIVCDRYSGTYSGGRFTAWNVEPGYIPHAICGDDCACADFWREQDYNGYYPVGVGNTIEEAIENLKKKLEGK